MLLVILGILLTLQKMFTKIIFSGVGAGAGFRKKIPGAGAASKQAGSETLIAPSSGTKIYRLKNRPLTLVVIRVFSCQHTGQIIGTWLCTYECVVQYLHTAYRGTNRPVLVSHRFGSLFFIILVKNIIIGPVR